MGWIYKLSITNSMKRDLILTAGEVSYGELVGGFFHHCIAPGESKEIAVKGCDWDPAGITFEVNYQDAPPPGKRLYGQLKLSVDIPYWKSKNKSECTTTGSLRQTGFTSIKNGENSFAGAICVYSTEEDSEDE